jgi:hypothetical protein
MTSNKRFRRFICACCHEQCVSTHPEEEAITEFEATFGYKPDPERSAVVCEDCYVKLMAFYAKDKPKQ